MAPHDGAHPISPLQLGPWLQHRLDASDPRYHTGMPFRLRGPLERSVLERWWQGAIARHDAMRITFGERDGVPYQSVAATREAPLFEHDVRGWDEERIYDYIVALHQRPQPLEQESPYALHVLERGPSDRTILMRSHHIVVDLGAEDTLFAELRDTIAGVELAPPAPSFLEFVRTHRERLAGGDGERLARFWQETLTGAPVSFDMPIDRARDPYRRPRGASHAFELLDPGNNERMRALCDRTKSSLFRVLFAAYLAFLYRHSGQDDILVGAPADCRGNEFDGSVGNFVNMMVLRGRVDPSWTFAELVSRASAVVRAAAQQRDYPFPSLIERLRPAREPGRSPLVQTSFNLTRLRRCPEIEGVLWPVRGSRWRGSLAGLEVESEPPIPAQEGHFELGLTVAERQTHLDAELKYDPDLFETVTIERFAGRLRTILEKVLDDPTCRVADLPMMPEAERRLVSAAWPDEPAPFTATTCHSSFEAQAKRTPEAIAVAHGSVKLTYAELDERANRIAHALRRRGIDEEALVGIYLPRSVDVVVGMLASLKAGGAFLPLDHAYPADRIAFMVEDAKPACIVTCRELASMLPEGVVRLSIDDEASDIAKEPASAPSCSAGPNSLAYVIYTSGSTGRPKGVLIEHRGVCNLAEALARAWELGPGHCVYCFASFSFDACIADVFPSLGSGAMLHLGPKGEAIAGAELHGFMRSECITHVTLTPAVWATLPLEPLPNLRVAVSAGEACAPETVATWGAGRTFFNNYGPTEITVCATIGRCDREDDARSIGRPMANIRTYVLDEAQRPVPAGVAGELCLGGVGVARGYLARPELTTERFVSDPFVAGGRMYRTGDLARWLPDGRLEYLGRRDTQVKLRGHRIELGEIEAAIRAYDGVADACAVVQGTADRRVLVAYVTPGGATKPDAAAIRAELAAALPKYMVPAQIALIDALPLTVNGKVDRKALATRQEEAPIAEHREPPRPGLEEQVAAIWSRALRLDRSLGRDEDFYAAGGDSLMALVVAHEIGLALGRDVSPSLLPTAPTLAAFCQAIERQRSAGPFVPLRSSRGAQAGQRPVFFLHPTGGEVGVYTALADRLPSNIRPLGIRYTTGRSIVEMAAAYSGAIAREQPEGPIVLVGWSMGGVLAVRVARDLEVEGRTVAAVVLLDSRLPRASGPSRVPTFLRILPDLGPAAELLGGIEAADLETIATRLAALPASDRGAAAIDIARERGLARTAHNAAYPRELAERARLHASALEAHDADVIRANVLSIQASHSVAIEAATRWAPFTSGKTEERVVDADHYTLLRVPAVDAVARALTSLLGS
jgi:amino acid adenylation domain-containing protein